MLSITNTSSVANSARVGKFETQVAFFTESADEHAVRPLSRLEVLTRFCFTRIIASQGRLMRYMMPLA
ncbi:MAG: hypothetical protein BWY76_01340 [bacterium ADurb.Bin429]|nr:MAG: hypothetical protein BWY76_01340 [bacterium ADurb.Bin429]